MTKSIEHELILIKPTMHADARGFFLESFQKKRYLEMGIGVDFVQDNHSFSKKNVIRGMHFQRGQAKLIYCPVGKIFDVAVDVRRDSPTFGKWEGFYLDEENHHQLYIPDGFAHGFAVMSEVAHVMYKISSFYDPLLESGFAYNDQDMDVLWPVEHPVVSDRDKNAKKFSEVV